MEMYEKLGVFYLGRRYDLGQQTRTDDLVLYDSKDLVTHAVCVGMTGSGKTGLCLALLEEAALDGIPAILIDPKGDLANLMLTFPDLRPEDFAPWVNAEDARREGLTPEAFAAQQADRWRRGLADWGQDGDRIRRLREAAEVQIYTPGSTAGMPISILKSLSAPAAAWRDDAELLGERINTTVTSLLGMLGIQAEALQSREHILLSTIFDRAWRQGQDLDLVTIIQQVQSPPITQIGVLDLETFYPAKDRFALVMALNNLLASPSFAPWLAGAPLDIQQFLYTPAGRPRLAILSIAHLGDAERMFFVSLLLNEVLGWTRAQSGTGSLRAILYMDEIFGYFPPVANPPSKAPLLTLLKQARAYGLGIVLATQNPVDLDYKGLANTGTWFIGRLQTERDKARVLEGLEGAAASQGGGFDRQGMEQILAGLGSRVFLMNNVHEDAPEILQTRWVMSYMRGPLTRDQIKVLMDPVKGRQPAAPAAVPAPTTAAAPAPDSLMPASMPPAEAAAAAPVAAAVPFVAAPTPLVSPAPARQSVPPEVMQVFLPLRGDPPAGAQAVYQPMSLGLVRVNFVDTKRQIDMTRTRMVLTPITNNVIPVEWEAARIVDLTAQVLEKTPRGEIGFAELPGAAAKAKNYAAWSKSLVAWLQANEALELLYSPRLKLISRPDERESDFRIRLQHAAREARDAAADKLREKYAPRINRLKERIRVAQQAVEREKEQAKQAKMQTAISFGATVLSAFVGRKAVSGSTMGRATTAARGLSRSAKEAQDIERAGDTVEALQAQLAELEASFKVDLEGLDSSIASQTETLESLTIKPKKTNITVDLLALAWTPAWRDAQGMLTAMWD